MAAFFIARSRRRSMSTFRLLKPKSEHQLQ
nr:MAG TPA: hypothetical protein [Caudoviricetes sp.]